MMMMNDVIMLIALSRQNTHTHVPIIRHSISITLFLFALSLTSLLPRERRALNLTASYHLTYPSPSPMQFSTSLIPAPKYNTLQSDPVGRPTLTSLTDPSETIRW